MSGVFDLAVIGGGAGGLLVLWHRRRLPHPPKRILWLDETGRFGQGPAYATRWPQHLLNVPARNMGALPDAPEHFLDWLHSAAGQHAAAAQGLPTLWNVGDFVPRMLYGAYLGTFLHEVRAEAAARGILLQCETAQATRIGPGYRIETAQGDAYQATHLVLAIGNQARAPWPATFPQPAWLGRMWDWAAAPPQPLPVVETRLPACILGSGLTAVDAVLQLRAQGWAGEIHLLSRHARLPAAHAMAPLAPAPLPDWPAPDARLSAYLRAFRHHQRAQAQKGTDWRAMLDALRPHTTRLWEGLSATDQRRFWRRLGALWNVHRHRMAPLPAAQLEAERAEGRLRLSSMHIADVVPEGAAFRIIARDGAEQRAALVVDCTGPSYDLRAEAGALAPLLASGHLALAANGLGLAMDARGLACADPAARIVTLGALAVGARWECTALPELRRDAALAAAALT